MYRSQFLAPAQSLEIGQECPVFWTCRPGNPSCAVNFQAL